MNTPLSWTAFLLTLATLNGAAVAALESPVTTPQTHPSLEERLTRIASVLKMREEQLPNPENPELAGGWGNTSGSRGFVNTRGPGWGNTSGSGGFVNTRGPGWGNTSGGGGFVNTRGPGWADASGGGGFVNTNPFRNGWSDRGSFLNRR